jgi:hypothetical protein
MAAKQQWQALAATVIPELSEAQPLGPQFIPASTALRDRMMHAGLLLAAGNDAHDAWQFIYLNNPTEMLGQAALTIARYNELHNRAVRVFDNYGGLIGAIKDGPLWKRNLPLTANPNHNPLWKDWVDRRGNAFDRIADTAAELRALAALDLVTVDAVTVALSFPANSPSRTAWMRAAQSLAMQANQRAGAASQSAATTRNAVTAEINVGSQILFP